MNRLAPLLLAAASLVPVAASAAADEELVELAVGPGVTVDLRYATAENFTHQPLYPKGAKCYLRRDVVDRLVRAQRALAADGFGLLVYDCYRPPSAQRKLWAALPDPRYVADPTKGSRHGRGAAVDLTLVDRHGRPVAMPTAWDEASERAHRDYRALPADVIAHRELLERRMREAGFVGLPSEWWHFDVADWERHPMLEASFEELAPLPPDTRQLVVVTAADFEAQKGRLTRYARGTDGRWSRVDEGWPVVIGRGLGWGLGLHPSGWAARFPGPAKREGDRRSPAGVFALGGVTGYAASPPSGATLPYRQATPRLYCVDDAASPSYNELALAPEEGPRPFESTEPMLRTDTLYERTVFVAHNQAPHAVPGAGSCIFLHVWSGADRPTIGCTAMPLSRLEPLIGWLAAVQHPLLVQLPTRVFDAVAPSWGLPKSKGSQ